MNKFGLITFFVGVVILILVVLYELVRDIAFSGISFSAAGIGGAVIFLGLIIMIISLIMERIRDSKEEENYDNDNN